MAYDTGSHEGFTRRALLERGAAFAAMITAPEGWRRLFRDLFAPSRPYYNASLRAEQWIRRSAVRDARGTVWPADPLKPAETGTDMYNGTPGIVLFYLEAWSATKDPAMLERAASGADYLIATMPTDASQLGEEGAGLYTGVAGIAFVLERTHAATGRDVYYAGAQRAMALLHAAAAPQGNGIAWNGAYDIIAGSAGIGLTMLWAERALKDPKAREAAVKAGRRLVEVGIPARGGLKWQLSPTVEKLYPNFSHGTAGVSYFLATLYLATKEHAFLEAAVAGAAYLDVIAVATGPAGKRVFHHEPGGEDLFYLSWCHGPAGTARLYHQLGIATGDPRYVAQMPRLAQGIIDSGVPEKHPDLSGYWNNISQCCGNSGVCEFFLSMYALTKERRHLVFAVKVADDTMARSTVDGDGLKWVQAENRISPADVVAQTGMMQGAAGVGLAMLHLDGVVVDRPRFVVLPDNPF
jgi:lantibiotic modifying enzyme